MLAVPPTFHGSRTFCALIVMPRSRSMSIRSRYCARIMRSSTTPVSCSIRSASVDLPWSMWAMTQKFRISSGAVNVWSANERHSVSIQVGLPPWSHARRVLAIACGNGRRRVGDRPPVSRFLRSWTGIRPRRCGSHDADGAGAGSTQIGRRHELDRPHGARGTTGSSSASSSRCSPNGGGGRAVVGRRAVDARQATSWCRWTARRTTGPASSGCPWTARACAPRPCSTRGGAPTPDATGALQHHYTGRGVLADARALQHERFGGSKLGSAFFGWLVAVGLTVLLGALAGGVGAAIGADRDRARSAPVVAGRGAASSRPTSPAGTSPAAWPASTAPATASSPGYRRARDGRARRGRGVRRRAVRRAQPGPAARPAGGVRTR